MKFLFLLISLIPAHVIAGQGNEIGHGGDPYAYEFSSIGREIANELVKRSPAIFVVVNASDFLKTVEEVLIVSDEAETVKLMRKRVVNGIQIEELVPVDAINYPSLKKILLNRKHWREATFSQKLLLVLHEYLGILGVERDNYNTSYEMSSILEAVFTSVMKNPAPALNYFGYCIAPQPLGIQTKICERQYAHVYEAEVRAAEQALQKCTSEHPGSKCEIISTELVPKTSQTALGYRYCEITVVARPVVQNSK